MASWLGCFFLGGVAVIPAAWQADAEVNIKEKGMALLLQHLLWEQEEVSLDFQEPHEKDAEASTVL